MRNTFLKFLGNKRLNKNNKGSGVLPGDKKGGKFVGSKKESKHNKKFRRMYG